MAESTLTTIAPKNVPNHYSVLYPPKDRIVFGTFLEDWSLREKFSEIKPHLVLDKVYVLYVPET